MTDLIAECPICSKTLNNQNRLITEDCGHSKCRQCLIAEVDGCEKCKESTNSHLIDANPTDGIRKESSSMSIERETKTRSSKIPIHIVRIQNEANEISYHCTVCDKHFKSRTQQYYHLFCNNSSSKPFKCNECKMCFSTSAHLKYHTAGHLKQSFQCSVCSKSFSKIQILRKHEKLHTTASEQCIECGAKLRNKEALNAHLMRHQNILPFECDKCDKRFSLRTSLRMHRQIVHLATNKFKCDLCGKVFNRNSSLKTHSLSHSNRREYPCSKCSRHFIDKKSLLRHSRIHSVKSKYKCTLCDTTSIRKDNILRHIRNMHPNEDKSCIEEVQDEESEYSESESSNEKVILKQLPEATNSITENEIVVPDKSIVVANSSVIRCIGNVTPVTIVEENQITQKTVEKEKSAVVIQSVVKIHKKLKKAYDPCEIYRKILLDDDTQDNDIISKNEESVNPANNQTKDIVQDVSSVICNGQQSNFSETHWRKNFKHNYQTQFD